MATNQVFPSKEAREAAVSLVSEQGGRLNRLAGSLRAGTVDGTVNTDELSNVLEELTDIMSSIGHTIARIERLSYGKRSHPPGEVLHGRG